MRNDEWETLDPESSRVWARIEQALQATTRSTHTKKEHVCRNKAIWLDNNKKVKIGKYIFTVEKRLGSGKYGTIYRVIDDNGKRYTLKRIKLESQGKMISAVLEYRAFQRIKSLCGRGKNPPVSCPKLIACVDASEILLLLSYIPGIMLGDALFASRKLPASWLQTQTILARLADSVAQLHTVGVAHLDLRPNNFVLDDSTPYVIDMGLSCTTEHVEDCSLKTKDKTPYLDPDFNTTEGVKPADFNAADVYALGALFRDVLDNYATRFVTNGTQKNEHLKPMSNDNPWLLVDTMQTKPSNMRPSASRVADIVRSWPTNPPMIPQFVRTRIFRQKSNKRIPRGFH
jgi:serine/threonine protein kinase